MDWLRYIAAEIHAYRKAHKGAYPEVVSVSPAVMMDLCETRVLIRAAIILDGGYVYMNCPLEQREQTSPVTCHSPKVARMTWPLPV